MPDSALQDCATRLRAVSDETRLRVVRQLLDGPRHVGDLNTVIGIEQSLLSHHLRVLRDAGIVTADRDGKHMLYRLAPDLESRRRGSVVDFGCCRLTFE